MHSTNLRRVFLLEQLPIGFLLSDRHVQILDKTIAERKRIRSVRDPKTRETNTFLEEISADGNFIRSEFTDSNRSVFPEVRRNRYSIELDDLKCEVDVFLGGLRGLRLITFYFDSIEDAGNFTKPEICGAEIKNPQGFLSERLAEESFAEVKKV